MTSLPFLSIPRPCKDALQWTNKQLEASGLRTVQTFDLHTARSGSQGCPCPHHGCKECDCQMVVLLVYGEAQDPVALTLHGSQGQTCFTLAEVPATGTSLVLTGEIKRILEQDSAA